MQIRTGIISHGNAVRGAKASGVLRTVGLPEVDATKLWDLVKADPIKFVSKGLGSTYIE